MTDTTTRSPATAPPKMGSGLLLTLVGLLLKVPFALAVIIYPGGLGTLVPDTGGARWTGLGNLAFLGAVVLLVAWRRKVGLLALFGLLVLSGIGVAELFRAGYAIWAVCQIGTGLITLIGAILAIAQGSFRGSKW